MTQFRFNTVSPLVKSIAPAALAAITIAFSGAAAAHHPDKENQPVHQRIDLIGPIGSRLPASYRRTYNRPTYWGGKVAYWIAPSSQEAMAWHHAVHSGAYEAPKKHLRLEQHYFYPKPYDALLVGPRRAKNEATGKAGQASFPELLMTDPLDPAMSGEQRLPEPALELPELELPDLQLLESGEGY